MVEPLKLRKTILVGIPIHKPDDRFLEVLPEFIEDCSKDYDIQVLTIAGKQLVDAQNTIAEYFLHETNCDYLLIMEDDHWGHKKEMLNALVNQDVEVSAMNYHSRHFPYPNCLMDRIPGRPVNECYTGLLFTEGFHKCDMAGYAMMLLKRGVFSKLDLPFFRLNENGGKDSYATDVDFCIRLKEAGIDIWGCFDFVLNHRDITKENRMQMVNDNMKEYRDNEVMNKLRIHRGIKK